MSIILLGIMKYECIAQSTERVERWKVYAEAKEYAKNTGKPMLVVGLPKTTLSHGFLEEGCGDICIDIDQRVLEVSIEAEGKVADVRNIPYSDKYFSSAFCSHTLEHLNTIDDCEVAVSELRRVADKVFIVSPHKWALSAWFNPEHHLWISEDAEQR